MVVNKAKEEAERRWMEKEGMDLGGDDKIRKILIGAMEEGGEASWWEVYGGIGQCRIANRRLMPWLGCC